MLYDAGGGVGGLGGIMGLSRWSIFWVMRRREDGMGLDEGEGRAGHGFEVGDWICVVAGRDWFEVFWKRGV